MWRYKRSPIVFATAAITPERYFPPRDQLLTQGRRVHQVDGRVEQEYEGMFPLSYGNTSRRISERRSMKRSAFPLVWLLKGSQSTRLQHPDGNYPGAARDSLLTS